MSNRYQMGSAVETPSGLPIICKFTADMEIRRASLEDLGNSRRYNHNIVECIVRVSARKV